MDPDVAKSWFEPVCFGSQLIATFDYIRSNDYPDTMLWSKKVSLCSMYTIPAEDDALPGLREMEEMLTRLITLPLEETLA